MLSPVFFPSKVLPFLHGEAKAFRLNKPVVYCLLIILLLSALADVVVKHDNQQKYFVLQNNMKDIELLKREQDRLLMKRSQLLAQYRLSLDAQVKLGMKLPENIIFLD